MMWNRAVKGDPVGLSHCLAFEHGGDIHGDVFLRADKDYSLGWMVAATPVIGAGRRLEAIKVNVPLKCMSSVDRFGEWYDHVHQDGGNLDVPVVKYSSQLGQMSKCVRWVRIVP